MNYKRSSFFTQKDLSIEKDNGIIKNVVVIQTGEALGHEIYIDKNFCLDVAILGKEKDNGIKARFGHPNMCSDALGTFIGRFINFRIEENKNNKTKVLADLKLSESCKNAPSGNLYDYIIDLAKNEPDMFGASICFQGEVLDEIDEETKLSKIKLLSFHACDLTDSPACNPDGLFSQFSMATIENQAIEILNNKNIFESLNSNKKIIEVLKSRGEEFLTFFKNLTGGEEVIKESETKKDETMFSKEDFSKIKNMFGADFVVNAIEKDLDFEEAKNEGILFLQEKNKESLNQLDEARIKIGELELELKTVEEELELFKAGKYITPSHTVEVKKLFN